jgi:DENN (AEX-3) domain
LASLQHDISSYNANRFIYEYEQQVQGLKLVSCAVILFTQILKPFVWSHPKILSLPSSKLQILSAPFPLLVGINSSPSRFYNCYETEHLIDRTTAFEHITKNEDILTVFLSKNLMKESKLQMLIPAQMMVDLVVPRFAGKKGNIQTIYNDYFFAN